MKFNGPMLLASLVIISCARVCVAQDVPDLVEQMKSFLNINLDPCDDFYSFACGKYIKEHPVPSNYTKKNVTYVDWPVVNTLEKYIDDKLREIVNQPFPIVNDFYKSCYRSQADIQRDANDTFEIYQKLIEILVPHVNTAEGLTTLLARLSLFNAFITFGSGGSQEGRGAAFFPGGSFYYSANDYKDKAKYDEELRQLVALFSPYSKNATKEAIDVINIEIHIANSTDYRDFPFVTIANATQQSGIDFLSYTSQKGYGYTNQTRIFLENSAYFRALPSYIRALPQVTLQRYLEWRVFIFLNDSNIVKQCDLNGKWNPECLGSQEEACVFITSRYLYGLVSLLYGEATISPKSRDSLLNLTMSLEVAFSGNLASRPWLDSAGVESARYKLVAMLRSIGIPDEDVTNYDEATILPNRYFNNLIEIYTAEDAKYGRSIYAPFNRTKLVANAYSPRAQMRAERGKNVQADPPGVVTIQLGLPDFPVYSYNGNYLWYPPTVVESSFYRADWPKLFQFAGLGVFAGEEISKAFNSFGIEFNATGQIGSSPIFDRKTVNAFGNQSTCVINQYNKYKVIGNITVDGRNTLNDNLADLAGLKTAYRAYQSYIATYGKEFLDGTLIPGFSTNQVFFLYSAQTMCSVENDYTLERGRYSTPNKWRVNGVNSQLSEFADAFKCPVGSPMNSATKCNVW